MSMLVLTTFGGTEQAAEAANVLVGEELAACVNILPGVTSIYRWEGEVQTSSEVVCLIKTTEAGFERLKARLLELHSYDLPEVIALPITAGHAPYLEWLAASVK
jgi:periplasmic divalent cation tolerance protein